MRGASARKKNTLKRTILEKRISNQLKTHFSSRKEITLNHKTPHKIFYIQVNISQFVEETESIFVTNQKQDFYKKKCAGLW